MLVCLIKQIQVQGASRSLAFSPEGQFPKAADFMEQMRYLAGLCLEDEKRRAVDQDLVRR